MINVEVNRSVDQGVKDRNAKYIMINAKQDEMYLLMGAGDITNVSKMLKFDE